MVTLVIAVPCSSNMALSLHLSQQSYCLAGSSHDELTQHSEIFIRDIGEYPVASVCEALESDQISGQSGRDVLRIPNRRWHIVFRCENQRWTSHSI